MSTCRPTPHAILSFLLISSHPARCRLQPPPPSPVVVNRHPRSYPTVHSWRSRVSGGWKPPLEQSASRRHLSSNADLFFASKLIFFPDHFLPNCFRFLHCEAKLHHCIFVIISSNLCILELAYTYRNLEQNIVKLIRLLRRMSL